MEPILDPRQGQTIDGIHVPVWRKPLVSNEGGWICAACTVDRNDPVRHEDSIETYICEAKAKGTAIITPRK